MVDVDHVQQLHLLELVEDVPNHNGGSLLISSHYFVEIDFIADGDVRDFGLVNRIIFLNIFISFFWYFLRIDERMEWFI